MNEDEFFHISLMLFYCSPPPAPLPFYFSAAPVQPDVIFMAARLFHVHDHTQQMAGSESPPTHAQL